MMRLVLALRAGGRAAAAALVFALAAACPAGAQTLGDVEVRAAGGASVVRIHFNAGVRFLQQIPGEASTLYTLRFELQSADDTVLRQTLEEIRRVPATAQTPALVVSYQPDPRVRVRQLIVEFDRPVQMQSRQGPNLRSLELVLHAPAQSSSSSRRFGVLLESLPIAQRDQAKPIPSQLQALDVLGVETVVDGEARFETTAGFFASREEAEAVRALALSRFPQARVVEISATVAARAVPAAPPTPPAAQAPPPVSPAAAIAIAAVPPPAAAASAPAPAGAASAPMPRGAAPAPAPTAAASAPAPVAAASAPAPMSAASGPAPTPASVATAPETAASAAADLPASAARAEPPAVAAGASQDEVERAAEELLRRARAALAGSRIDEALALLNELLKLPPNRQSQEAQELIGQAWERAGSASRARAEYDLYLRLYPEGEGAARVAARLASLGKPGAPDGTVAGGSGRDAARPFAGSIAQYYYGGKAKTQSLVNIAAGIDQATLSRTTESAIVTSLDLSGRVPMDAGSEGRMVVRGSTSTNLLPDGHSKSAMNSVYFDYRRGPDGLAARFGRQSPISGGLLGLFDGVSLAVPIKPGLKLDVMGGAPANTLVSAPGERLLATVLEADGLFDRWGGSLYLVDQSIEGITNRRGLGGEARYAGERWSLNGLIDYETEFRLLNALSLQGSYQVGTGTTVTMLGDLRRAPSLQLSNALISSGATSLKTLLQTKSLDEVRADALATSATAKQLLVSLSQPLDKRWQLAMDLRYSEIGALPAVGDFEATPATGAQVTFSTQLVGTNLYSRRDINNVNLSVTHTPFFNGVQLSYSNVTGVLEESALSIEPSLRLYTQRDQQDVALTRVGPGLRLSYRFSRRASLLAEALYEDSRTSGPTGNDHTQAAFFYVGYRYEIF